MTATAENSRSLGEVAYEQLRDLILRGLLTPGEQVTEKQLRAKLGLGGTPVRDALARLDNEGLILTVPRKGYQVSPLTLQGIDDLFDVWRIIGPAIVVLAAKKLGPAGSRELRRQLMAAKDPKETVVDSARRTWTTVCRATANNHLIDTFTRLELHLARILFLTMNDLEHLPGSGRAHHSMTDALALDTKAEMERHTSEFIDGFHDEVVELVRRFPSVMSAELHFAAS